VIGPGLMSAPVHTVRVLGAEMLSRAGVVFTAFTLKARISSLHCGCRPCHVTICSLPAICMAVSSANMP